MGFVWSLRGLRVFIAWFSRGVRVVRMWILRSRTWFHVVSCMYFIAFSTALSLRFTCLTVRIEDTHCIYKCRRLILPGDVVRMDIRQASYDLGAT